MHEMSIALALVDQLESLADEHGVTRIERVAIQAGIFRQIVPEALDVAFEAAAAGTRAEGAALDLEIVPAEAQCRRCGHRFEPELDAFLCDQCGQADVELLKGDDIILASITAQEPDGEDSDGDPRRP